MVVRGAQTPKVGGGGGQNKGNTITDTGDNAGLLQKNGSDKDGDAQNEYQAAADRFLGYC